VLLVHFDGEERMCAHLQECREQGKNETGKGKKENKLEK
jgi:hypothetical protein